MNGLMNQVPDLGVVCGHTVRCHIRKVQRFLATRTTMSAPDGSWGRAHPLEQLGPPRHQTGQHPHLRHRRLGSAQDFRFRFE